MNVNITLSVDPDVLVTARRRAESLGTSINQMIRDYLLTLTSSDLSAEEQAERFLDLCRNPSGDSDGWKFNREELHDRGVL